MTRVLQLQNGTCEDDAAWDEEFDLGTSRPASTLPAPSLACSTEWHGTLLYYQCVRERKGEDGDSLPLLAEPAVAMQQDIGPAGETLRVRWERLRQKIDVLWRELLVSPEVCENIRQASLSSVTAGSVYQLEMHLQELLDYREETKQLIQQCLTREEVLEAVQHAHALGVNDTRLNLLREDLVALDRLGTNLVRAIGVWSRRFGHLAVDSDKSPGCRERGMQPHAVFVWIGRDMVERIQTESEAVSSGNVHTIGGMQLSQEGSVSDGSVQRPLSSGKAKPGKFISAPLVSMAMVSQKFAVSEVLHEGPPPNWYHPRIAKAGIAAIRRGVPCGGGDKRL